MKIPHMARREKIIMIPLVTKLATQKEKWGLSLKWNIKVLLWYSSIKSTAWESCFRDFRCWSWCRLTALRIIMVITAILCSIRRNPQHIPKIKFLLFEFVEFFYKLLKYEGISKYYYSNDSLSVQNMILYSGKLSPHQPKYTMSIGPLMGQDSE